MATSKSLGEFSKRMQVVASGTLQNVERAIRKGALVADQVAVTSTPVDTGRARAGWLVSIGEQVEGEGAFRGSPGEPENAAKATSEALAQGEAVIASYKVDAGPVFIQNNVNYIGPLDEGSSAQAPEGMTAQALQAAQQVIRKEKVLGE